MNTLYLANKKNRATQSLLIVLAILTFISLIWSSHTVVFAQINTYDRAAVVSWALQNNRNDGKFYGDSEGRYCTTYVGRALRAGGLNVPTNWIGNHQIVRWMLDNPLAWDIRPLDQLIPGDFVLYSNNSNVVTDWSYIDPSSKGSLWSHVALVIAPQKVAAWNAERYGSGIDYGYKYSLGVHIRNVNEPLADGSLIKEKTNSTVYVIYGGAKFWVPNEEYVKFYGGWSKLKVVPDGTLPSLTVNIPHNGTMLKEKSSDRVYVIQNSRGIWLTNATEVIEYGGWNMVRTVPDGSFPKLYQIESVNSSKVIYVPKGNYDGEQVIQYSSDTSTIHNLWRLKQINNTNYYEIRSEVNGKCLTVANMSKLNGAIITLQSCYGTTNQHWELLQQNGSFIIKSRNSGKVLDIPGASKENGIGLIQWDANGGSNQQWRFLQQW